MSECPPRGRWLTACLRPLEPEERAALTTHQRTCAACQGTYDLFRTLGRVERDEEVPESRSSACPGGDALDALADVDRAMPPAEFVDHIAGCPACLLRLDRRLGEARRTRIAELAPRPANRPWWKRFGK